MISGRKKKRTNQDDNDVLGTLLNFCVYFLNAYPYFGFMFGLYVHMDPFMMMYNYWIPSASINRLGFWFKLGFQFSRLFQFINFLQFFRLVCMTVVFAILTAHSFLNCLFLFTKSAGLISHSFLGKGILVRHSIFQIILQNTDDCVQVATGGVMFTGFLLSVGFNFVALKMYHMVPMPFYLVFPTFAALLPCLFNVMLPMLIAVYETDKTIHDKWRYHMLRSLDLKLLKRKVWASKVIRICAGIFGFAIFECTSGVKTRYYYESLSYTINGLVSVDPLKIQGTFLRISNETLAGFLTKNNI